MTQSCLFISQVETETRKPTEWTPLMELFRPHNSAQEGGDEKGDPRFFGRYFHRGSRVAKSDSPPVLLLGFIPTKGKPHELVRGITNHPFKLREARNYPNCSVHVSRSCVCQGSLGAAGCSSVLTCCWALKHRS